MGKNVTKPQGGIFLNSHCIWQQTWQHSTRPIRRDKQKETDQSIKTESLSQSITIMPFSEAAAGGCNDVPQSATAASVAAAEQLLVAE